MAGKGGKRSTSFKPGQSGNPGGRPKVIAEVVELAREQTKEAVDALTKIMKDKKSPPAAIVSAATAILDRGWGKPLQNMLLDDRRSIKELTNAELTAILRDEEGGSDGAADAEASRKQPDSVH